MKKEKKLWLLPTAVVVRVEAEDIICISVEEAADLDSYNNNTVVWDCLR